MMARIKKEMHRHKTSEGEGVEINESWFQSFETVNTLMVLIMEEILGK